MTAPLTPPDCDLTDFPFMPLQVERLRRSKAWLICKRNPALAFYMVNLWTACWHDTPAGSIEDDDDVLADLAMCDPAKWLKIKADVLRGWVKCDDGRLYHPTVSEKAVEAWESKRDQRWRTECARIKKHNDRHGTKIPRPTFDEWVSAGCPQGQRLPVPRDTGGTGEGQGGETASKGEREGQGQGELKEKKTPPRKRADDAPAELVSVTALAAEGVDQKHAAAWFKVRKDKGSKGLTSTTWEAIKADAAAVGMTAAQAVHTAAVNEWRGFRASWLDQPDTKRVAFGGKPDPTATVPPVETTEQYIARMASERAAEKLSPEQQARNEAARIAAMAKAKGAVTA